MNRMRTIGICTVVALTISLVGVASASAAEPEYGICQKNTTVLHQWSDKNCQVEVAPGTGLFEWKPGPNGSKGNFTAESGAVKWNVPSAGSSWECTHAKYSGKVTSDKQAVVPVLTFFGCKSSGEECHSAGQPAETVQTKELLGTLGYIGNVGDSDIVGEDFTGTVANGGYLAEFQCGSAAVKLKLKGSLICEVKPVDTKPTSTNGLVTCKESGGNQVPERFEGGVKDTLIVEFSTAPGVEFNFTLEDTSHVNGKLWIKA
jgi:hypothetical protein